MALMIKYHYSKIVKSKLSLKERRKQNKLINNPRYKVTILGSGLFKVSL